MINSAARRRQVVLWLFVTPALVVFCAFLIFPILYAALLSLYEWEGYAKVPWSFVGATNYLKLLRDSVFLTSLKNTILFSFVTTTVLSTAGLLFALIIASNAKRFLAFRTLYFLPSILGVVPVALAWRKIYEPNFGLLDGMLRLLGIGALALPWLREPRLIVFSLSQVDIWQFTGYSMVIYLAGLQTISRELIESAQIDGASRTLTNRYIVLPLMVPFIRIVVTLNLIGSMKVFDLVWAMTQGGPMHASEMILTYMYAQAFRFNNMGYASAISMFLVLLIVTTSLVFRAIVKEES
jgi:raffinose/stachyose/melibiose transport system permease protein